MYAGFESEGELIWFELARFAPVVDFVKAVKGAEGVMLSGGLGSRRRFAEPILEDQIGLS